MLYYCHPPSEGEANEVGTKGGGRGANQGSPKMTISLSMLTKPLESTSRLPRTTIQRHARGGNHTGGRWKSENTGQNI